MFGIGLSVFLPIFFLIVGAAVFFLGRRTFWILAKDRGRAVRFLKPFSFFLAFFFIALVSADVGFVRKGDAANYLFIFDITPSQMVEDYFDGEGKPVSRLETAKRIFREALAILPENSSVALAAISDDGSEPALFLGPTPKNERRLIELQLELVDWWNAWGDGSNLGLLAIPLFQLLDFWKKPAQIIVFSDGAGFPIELKEIYRKDAYDFFQKNKSQTRFLFVGSGKLTPSEVPRFNEQGEKVGCFSDSVVIIEGGVSACYTSALNESVMKASAAEVGGAYLPMDQEEEIKNWLISNPLSEPNAIDVRVSYGWIFALLSLPFFLMWFLL